MEYACLGLERVKGNNPSCLVSILDDVMTDLDRIAATYAAVSSYPEEGVGQPEPTERFQTKKGKHTLPLLSVPGILRVSINVLAVRYLQDQNQQNSVFYRVDNSEIPFLDTVKIVRSL